MKATEEEKAEAEKAEKEKAGTEEKEIDKSDMSVPASSQSSQDTTASPVETTQSANVDGRDRSKSTTSIEGRVRTRTNSTSSTGSGRNILLAVDASDNAKLAFDCK